MRLTLPRLLVTGFWVACGMLLAMYLGKLWGIGGYCIGFVVGIVAAFLFTWIIILGRVLLFLPFPPCRNGKCNRLGEYVWQQGTIYGWTKWGVYSYRCKCGDYYIRDRKRFMQLLSDGTKQPYKKLIGIREWADDLDSQH